MMPDDCSLEDIQYHLYVIEKVRNGLETADAEDSIPQEEVEQRLTGVLARLVLPACDARGDGH